MITIIIADDQKLFATSLKSVLENDDKELSVIGIAGNGKEAVDLADRLKPDLILMDVRMPIMDGVEAVRIIHQRLPEIKIIMLTTYDDDEFVNQAILHGSVGYLLKDIASRTDCFYSCCNLRPCPFRSGCFSHVSTRQSYFFKPN